MAIQDRDTLKALITSTLPDNLTKDISAAVIRAVVNNICDSVIFYNENAAKQNVRVATTANGTLVSAFEDGDTVDGVTLATGDRILLKDQSTASQNGIYTVNASGAPTRATDFDSADDISLGNTFYVTSGTANAGKFFYLSSPTGTITIGSSNLGFTDLANSAANASTTTKGLVELATTAETTTGTDATRAVTPDGLHDMTSLAGAAWFLDEDNMASDSATKTASQQSIKAYVDSVVISGGGVSHNNTSTYNTVKINIQEIGDWDMDTDGQVDLLLPSGATADTIRRVSVMIRRDNTGVGSQDLYDIRNAGSYLVGFFSSAWRISLLRDSSGTFDSTTFNATSYNRGWVTIEYEDTI